VKKIVSHIKLTFALHNMIFTNCISSKIHNSKALKTKKLRNVDKKK